MKVRPRLEYFRPSFLVVTIVALFICTLVASPSQARAQTVVTISNAVETPGIDRPGINLGGLGGYGSQQLFKSLNYVNGGYFPGTYAATTYPCRGGANTTTSWYNDVTDNNGYPANFWAGATFVAINAATGSSYGSGTVTGSTANTGGSGITFTLSPAITAPCNPSQNDVLIVRSNSPNAMLSPYQVLNGHVCSNAAWDLDDTSPSSTNTQQSLEMPSGCGLTFYIDATVSNRTNTNPSLASQQVNFINLNGSYNATFKAKCLGGACSVSFSLLRFGSATFVANTTVNPSAGGPGAGWTTYNYPFTASETGTQNGTIGYSFTCTGTCLLQDADVIEGSTLPGNTTVFRDAVVSELQKIHPGSIRYMDASQWCSDVADEIAPTGNRRWCGSSNYTPGAGQPIGYDDVLALANFLGSDVLISVGQLNQPSDWTTLINWLNSSGWISKYANSGHTIYLEDGNEAWNSGVGATLYFGNGLAYGYTLGPNMAAAKAASGYNPGVIKLVADGWVSGSQGYGPFGWIHNVMTVAQGTPNGLPDFVDDAPYTLNYLGNFDASGGNVATTGAPFVDEFAEIANIDSVPSPPLYTQSMYLNQQYAKANFGLNTLVYEVNQSTLSGVPANELQLDQIGASVGSALAVSQHVLLMQRDSQVTGPIHVFTLAEPYTGYTCIGCGGGTVIPLWGTNLFMATGPGQTPGASNADRPLNIALEVIDNAIGSNNDLMSITQTGTPTYSYPGGQVQGSSNSIVPNNAVPYVNCFSYSNLSSAWTTICFNNNLTAAESVTLSGAGAPTGSVSETVFPGSSNVITDNNENTYLGASSVAPEVNLPSATTTSGTSYSIPPASMIALTYTTGAAGTPTLVAPTFSPGTGNYSGTTTVNISFPSGSTGCVGINTIPTATTPGTCGSGGTTYTGSITVSSSETVNAIATEAGSINSPLGSAAYTLTFPTAATPTFSLAAGTYNTSQSVTISDATAGTTIYYTTNGATPTTSSSVYGGAITISASETLEAIAVESGYTTSAPATAAYTISPILPSPSFSPGPGTYTASQSVTISDTAGATMYYTTNGTTPTTSSSVYSGAITVSASEKLEAIAVESGYTTSAPATAAYTITPISLVPMVSTSCYQGSGSSTLSLGPINTTGANAIAIVVSSFNNILTVTDNMGNGSATGLPAASGNSPNNQIFYWQTPAVGSAHTFTVNGSSGLYASACVFVMSGIGGTYSGAQSENYAGYASNTCQAGSITPSSGPQIVVAGFGVYTPAGVPTVDSSYSLGAYQAGAGGSAFGEAAGYLIQSSGAPTNPKWSWSNSASSPSCVIAAFGGGSALPKAATPTFSPGTGTYATSQSVTIGETTPGTTIYYTTDGTTPTTSSSVYGGAITVSSSETLEAIAVETGYNTSAPATAAYTITPVLPTPSFSPGGSTYAVPQSVVISDATPGTTIYYTTNGTTPTTSSYAYSGAVTVSSSETLEAIAVANGYTTSAPATAAYTINTSSGNYINFGTGQFTSSSFFLNGGSSVTSGGALQLTDGGNGEARSAWFANQVPVASFITDFTFQLINPNADGMTFVIQGQGPNALGANGPGLAYQGITNSVAVKFDLFNNSGEGPDSTGLYIDGAVPTVPAIDLSSTGIDLHSGHVINANIVYDGTNLTMTLTDTITNASVIEVFPVNIPAAVGGSMAYVGFTGCTGSFTSTQDVLTWSYSSSGVSGQPASATPSFSPGGGTYTTSLPVTISDATPGATIYYTTNGTTPTASSSVYGGTITVSSSETLEAIAVATGYSNSTPATAAYTISAIVSGPTFSPAGGSYAPSQPSTAADYGLHIHGDSISVPSGFGCSDSAICYDALLDTEVGFDKAANTNDSNGGDQSEDMNVRVFTDENPTATNNPIQTTLIGTNDALYVGSPAGYLTTFAQVQAATHSWLALANTSKIAGSLGSVSGTCTADTTYANITGEQCTTSNSTVTWSNVTAPNGVIYLWYRAFQTSNGTATCTIDSSPATDTLTSSTSLIAQALVGMPTNHALTNDVQLARFAGYSASSPHTIVCTNSNTFTYVGLGLPPATRNTALYSPVVAMGGVIYYQNDGSSELTSAYNNQSGSVAATLYGDNLNVLWFNPRLYMDSNCDMGAPGTLGCPSSTSPPFHPSNVGHRQLANGFETTLNVLTTPASVPVSMSDTASGTSIYYTTDGSTPTTASTLYTGPIRVSGSETLEAIAVEAGSTSSSVTTAAYSISSSPPLLSAPTFTPAAGSYATSQSVTINDATAATTIYYTTNGTTPTISSSIYGGAITVSASETLEAIAVKSGFTTSAPASAAYTINTVQPTLPAPGFSPGGGTYTTAQQVTISDATAGATIYYTTDGTRPTTSSSTYGGPITVSSSETLEAIAVESGYTTSAPSSAAYAISAGTGTGSGPTVSTSCYQGSGASSLTMGPINTTGANAIAIVVASFNNILTVTDNEGNGNAIGLTAASGGSPNNQIFYWQTPSVGSGHTFTVNGGSGLYASACVFVMSGVSGTYSGAQNANSVGYASNTCQAGITPASGPQVIITGFSVYTPTGIPTLDSSYTVGAYQAGAGGSAFGEAAGYLIQSSGAATNPRWNWSNSASSPGCVIAAFGGGTGGTTQTTLPTPSFSPAGGTYTTAQVVAIGDTAAGTTIYYTTNGTAPTTSASVYSGPITVSSSETLEAIAVESGFTTSAPATTSYTINTNTTGGATYINFASGQFTASSFYLNGGPTVTSNGLLQMTDGGYGEARSAWFTNQVPVSNFVTDFTFQIPYANADGMAFVIQAQGPAAVGAAGGFLGYQGINNSVAVKFDLYDNAGEGPDSTGLYTGGAAPMLPSVNLSSTGINLHSGDVMDAHMVYDGTNLTMTLTDTVTSASVVEVFPVNIPAAVGGRTAYVGFTGGTGGLASTQNVLTWSYGSGT